LEDDIMENIDLSEVMLSEG